MTVRFCPQCGAKTVPQASFCAACGEALPGTGKSAPRRTVASSSISWRTLAPGLTVLSLYLVIGTGLWLFVLQSQPFPSSVAPAGNGQASTGGSALPQDHPPVALPDEAKKRIAELVDKANAAPQDVTAWKTLADIQAHAARIDSSYRSAALSSYRHVLELTPNDLDALHGVGNIYYDFEEYAKATEYYQKYLALNPEDPSVRTDLGTMYLYSNDADRAIAEYQAVLAKKPDFFQAHFNLGIAYQEKGDSDKARESLAQAKALTTDKNIQARIDQVLAQFDGSSPTAVAAAPTDPARSPFQQAVEKLFRGHEIMGPRISRIEWPAPAEAQVFFQNFPMAAMPPDVRERFLGKLRTQVTEAQSANRISGTAKIELIDADTKQVMETITTAAS
ncbi:MAG: tetratricopeptide repeat protein [Deltaproteobacteria bacterium]|nr:tetratricopeptide repeat protein [Deltaproteobacteria bacterium]